ncbi:MAG TPA: hypothetical protein VMX76_00690 [Nevskiaceae bacterium]|nr:hypothetical protein [Nevskiaceae bacterium]
MDMRRITKIALAWELVEQKVPKIHVAQQAGDLETFIDQYSAAKRELVP